MAGKRQRVFVERENEKGKTMGWRNAWLTIDMSAGALMLESMGALAKKWSMNIRGSEVQAFEIFQISDTSTLAMIYGGGLLGWGIAALMSRWTKIPALKLQMASAQDGSSWVHLRAPGISPKKTRQMANEIATILRENSFSGMMPDLADEAQWKSPVGPILVGCGVVIVAVICIVIAIGVIAGS